MDPSKKGETFRLIQLDDQASAAKASSAYKNYSKTTPLDESMLEMGEDSPLTGEKAPKSTIVRKKTTSSIAEPMPKDPPPKESKPKTPPKEGKGYAEPLKESEKKAKEKPKTKELKTSDKSDKPKKEKAAPKKKVKTKEERDKELEETAQKIAEIIAKIQDVVFSNIAKGFNLIFNMMLKLGTLMVQPFIMLFKLIGKILYAPVVATQKVITMLTERFEKKKEEESEYEEGEEGDEEGDEEEDDLPPERPEIKASFNDIIALNIVFIDNYKRPLYTKNQTRTIGKLGPMEEKLILDNAIAAIKECAEFTKDLPSPTKGFYAGKRTFDVMSAVEPEDVQMFLGFVKKFPGKYIGKTWKMSETFATWIINNAPTE